MTGADRPDEGPGARHPPHGAAEPEEGAPAPPGHEHREGPTPIRGAAPGTEPARTEEGRRFVAGGETWIARPAGESAIGHGAGARAYLVAVRFYRAEDETPVCEALIPRGRFEMLYDEELEDLLRGATPLAAEPGSAGRETPRAGEAARNDEPPPDD